jgi:hypothetical protein
MTTVTWTFSVDAPEVSATGGRAGAFFLSPYFAQIAPARVLIPERASGIPAFSRKEAMISRPACVDLTAPPPRVEAVRRRWRPDAVPRPSLTTTPVKQPPHLRSHRVAPRCRVRPRPTRSRVEPPALATLARPRGDLSTTPCASRYRARRSRTSHISPDPRRACVGADRPRRVLVLAPVHDRLDNY